MDINSNPFDYQPRCPWDDASRDDGVDASLEESAQEMGEYCLQL
jgi:hypothetical protein